MSNIYTSTRDHSVEINSSTAITKAISDDGGLFILKDLNNIKIDYHHLLKMSYQEIAFEIVSKFFDDLDPNILKQAINDAYKTSFDNDLITPLTKIGSDYCLELFHGRTLAFKDIALTLLPYLMEASNKKSGNNYQSLILTATSGDTGKAAIEGFKNIKDTKIIVFYPLGGVSEIQAKQMISSEGDNVVVCGIHGNFDDAQACVKEALNNPALKALCHQKNYQLASANSINIGRLVPQIVYYFNTYVTLLRTNEIKDQELINFVVPTGNFGNLLAGYMAKQLGLPINKLICASNCNNVLSNFFFNGEYTINKTLNKTLSPSMDILISSNLERLLYYKTNGDSHYINTLMHSLLKDGHYKISDPLLTSLKKDFYATFATDLQTSETINDVYHKYKYILDPHSAVGYKVLSDYKLDTNDQTKNALLCTASPYKFPSAEYAAIHGVHHLSDYEALNALEKLSNDKLPNALKDLKDAPILHHHQIKRKEMIDFIKSNI